MELRTIFSITPSDLKITYNDPVMFIGSCFAASMGKQLETGQDAGNDKSFRHCL